jgi:hypothetical protein
MLYFNSFPKVITSDFNGNGIVMTNIMVRTEIIPSLLKNPLLFYSYDIKESDRPDIIANKYYGDSNRFWMVLYANEIFDPLWEWPLTSTEFGDYLNDKYAAAANGTSVLAYTQSTVYQYIKTISTTDSGTNTTTTKTIIIDKNTYNNTVQGKTVNSFPDGSTVTQLVTVNVVSIYDYELQQNEAKRNINLINSSYAQQLERDFASLMRQ